MEILDLLMRKLKKEKVDDIVLTYSENHSRQIKFSDNKIVKIGVEELSNVGLFVVKDKKIVATSFKEFSGDQSTDKTPVNVSEKKVDKLVKNVMEMLKSVKPKEDYKGINCEKFKYKEIKDCYDSKVRNIDDVDFVDKGINASLREGTTRTNGIFEAHVVNETLLTSEGTEFSEEGTELYFSIRSFFDKDESGHMNGVSRVLKNFNIEDVGKQSGTIAHDSKNPLNGKKGKMDVIFSPLAFAPILNAIGESSSIFSLNAGLSFFNKLNQKVGSSQIDIYDDGRLVNGLGSTKADMEGVPTGKTKIVEKGIVKNYLHNTSTAKENGVESTGNAGLISPEPWNIVIGKGGETLNNLIKNVKNGLYVTNVWYTRFANYHTGDFSTIPRDGCFMIKNGKILESWKGIRISENVLNILKNIRDLENKQTHLRSWEAPLPILCPHILVENCNITIPTK
jgi:PmbA protein